MTILPKKKSGRYESGSGSGSGHAADGAAAGNLDVVGSLDHTTAAAAAAATSAIVNATSAGASPALGLVWPSDPLHLGYQRSRPNTPPALEQAAASSGQSVVPASMSSAVVAPGGTLTHQRLPHTTKHHSGKRSRHKHDRVSPHRQHRKHRERGPVPVGSEREREGLYGLSLAHPLATATNSVVSNMATSTASSSGMMCVGGGISTRTGSSPASPSHADSMRYDEAEYNSDDEHVARANPGGQPLSPTAQDEKERHFERTLKATRNFIISKMREDGACLFRAVADHVYGDQDMHDVVRTHCMDYMSKNRDYYIDYITEDFDAYISRKREASCHGNHLEMHAMCEMYNRTIEVYQYASEPMKVFQGSHVTDNEPIRLSYHDGCHYNSVVDPSKATVGVGLGLPSFQPGSADKSLMRDALKMSEEYEIEQTMLKDKLKASDWDATSSAIEEQVARQSYLDWLREQEEKPGCSSKHALEGRSPPPPSLTLTTTSASPTTNTVSQCRPSQTHTVVTAAKAIATNITVTPSPTPSTSQCLAAGPSSSTMITVVPEETRTFLQAVSPAVLGLSEDWEDEELIAALAASQQDYMEQLKKDHSDNS